MKQVWLAVVKFGGELVKMQGVGYLRKSGIRWALTLFLLASLGVNFSGCGGGGGTSTTRLNLYVPKPDEIATDTATGETYVKGILLLYAKENASPEAIAELAKSLGGNVVGSIPQVRLYQVKIEGASAEVLREIAQNLSNHPLLEGAYLDTAMKIAPPEGEEEPPPLEEERSRLAPPAGEWKYDDVNWDNDNNLLYRNRPYRNWYLKMIRAHIAWDITRGSRDHSKIAIIDSGFDAQHEDLNGNVTMVSQLTHPKNARNWQAHGTNVAGLAAAVGGNNRGVCGVCWFASLRLFGLGMERRWQDLFLPTTRSLWTAALILSAESGARVVNMSLSEPQGASDFYRPIMRFAKQRDCLIVVSAGNDNNNADKYLPQAFAGEPEFKDYVLVVGAVDIDGQRSSFSNYGDIVELYAPGGNINFFGFERHKLFTIVPRGYDHAGVGTSFAAPLVTGAAGLLLAVNPNLSAPELKRLLIEGARVQNGIRILDVARSVQLAAQHSNIAIPVLTAEQSVFERAPAVVTFDVRGSVIASSISRIVLDFGDGTSPREIRPADVPTTTVQHTYRSTGVYTATLRFYGGGNTPIASDSITINIGQSNVDVTIK